MIKKFRKGDLVTGILFTKGIVIRAGRFGILQRYDESGAMREGITEFPNLRKEQMVAVKVLDYNAGNAVYPVDEVMYISIPKVKRKK